MRRLLVAAVTLSLMAAFAPIAPASSPAEAAPADQACRSDVVTQRDMAGTYRSSSIYVEIFPCGGIYVEWADAAGNYVRLHAAGRAHLVRRTMAALEQELDPDRFVRVHRSAIVRRDFVTGLRRDGGGRWWARLGDGEEQKVGRLYLHNAKGLAGR